MLIEVPNITQYEQRLYRRWFHDDFFDLYTWESADGVLDGFQLCYAKSGTQRALRWSTKSGFQHEGVDANEEKPGRAMSALFVADGVFDPVAVGGRFDAAAIALPARIREFVADRIHQYPAPPLITDSNSPEAK